MTRLHRFVAQERKQLACLSSAGRRLLWSTSLFSLAIPPTVARFRGLVHPSAALLSHAGDESRPIAIGHAMADCLKRTYRVCVR